MLTRTELAGFLGVNPVTITKWQGEGLPVAQRGGKGRESKYRMAEIWAWGLARERARAGAAGVDMSLPVERAKLARVQTRKAELEVRRREGELVEVAEFHQVGGLMVHAIRQGVLRLPQAVADAVVAQVAGGAGPAAVEATLMQACRDVLRELASWKGPEPVAAPVQAAAG